MGTWVVEYARAQNRPLETTHVGTDVLRLMLWDIMIGCPMLTRVCLRPILLVCI